MEQRKYRSDDIGLLSEALAIARGNYKQLVANEEGPFGKFANQSAVENATCESLAANALAFYQSTEQLDEGAGAVLLNSMISHKSNQWISSCWRIVTSSNDRNTNDRLAGFKRVQACTLLGISPSKNDPSAHDDNFEELAEQDLIERIRLPKDPKKEEINRNETINKDQYQELIIELSGYEEVGKDIMQVYGITTLADLPRSEYHKARARILKIKKVQEDYEQRRLK